MANKNYNIELFSENKPNLIDNFLDFNELSNKLSNYNTKNNTYLVLDFKSINSTLAKKNIRKLIKLKKKINIGLLDEKTDKYIIAKAYNYDSNNYFHKFIISSIYAIFKNNKKEMYNYIYDEVCDYLDQKFYHENLCEFKENKCGEKRNTTCTVGCCRHYKDKLLGPMPFNKFVVCEYLKDKRCSAKCLSCKLFTCDYLNKKGIKFRIKDIFLLDFFFNPIQKFIIKTSVYTPKDKIIKKLLFWSL